MKKLIMATTLFISLISISSGKETLAEKVNRAAKENNVALMKEYIRLGGNLDIQDKKGYTPLIFAAYYGHEKLVSLLLKNNANPCLKDSRGNTALMGAIFKGNVKVAYKLMKSSCTISQKNNAKQTALMYASLFGRKEIAKELMAKGSSAKEVDANGESAITVAKKQMNGEMVQVLENE